MSNSNQANTEQAADRFEVREDDPGSLVAARLRRSGYAYLRGVQCESRDGIMVLIGSVPTFHLKQIAQTLAAHTPGVRLIDNRLHVTNLLGRVARSTRAG